MKNFFLIVFALICIAFLFIGNKHWDERIAGVPALSEGKTAEEPSAAAEENNVRPQLSNWPEHAQQRFMNAIEEERDYKVAIIGSTALGKGEDGWSEQLKENLTVTFNELDIRIYESETTSVQFMNDAVYGEILEYGPDLVLFEPFTLVNNLNLVPYERNHEVIMGFYNNLKSANGDVELILQPSYPLAGATIYPKQVEKLKEFAEENGFTFLDHWTAWPEAEELGDYLTDSNESPNDKGHELWAGFLKDYFIAE
ncbi:SGNH/GDSL hydrolase family protein [Rossellomorea aquimaris]|uniref:SGNH/GDSL hydrolase family protein n=1 Tax=Rossellomorea aquimaris TaxID=189382 RepID=UPI001CD7F0CD|nr:SGNH/GDSL hydrolase family protein [Rossellomorea aquimaris]MCA1055191.1 SGNH/GDSL hydrolase family protein [Rossellomorea aquimaris]